MVAYARRNRRPVQQEQHRSCFIRLDRRCRSARGGTHRNLNDWRDDPGYGLCIEQQPTQYHHATGAKWRSPAGGLRRTVLAPEHHRPPSGARRNPDPWRAAACPRIATLARSFGYISPVQPSWGVLPARTDTLCAVAIRHVTSSRISRGEATRSATQPSEQQRDSAAQLVAMLTALVDLDRAHRLRADASTAQRAIHNWARSPTTPRSAD